MGLGPIKILVEAFVFGGKASTEMLEVIDLTQGDDGTWSYRIGRGFSNGKVCLTYPTVVPNLREDGKFQRKWMMLEGVFEQIFTEDDVRWLLEEEASMRFHGSHLLPSAMRVSRTKKFGPMILDFPPPSIDYNLVAKLPWLLAS